MHLTDRRLGKEAVIKAGPDLEIFYPRYLLTWLHWHDWHDWHVGFIPMYRCLSGILLLLCHSIIPLTSVISLVFQTDCWRDGWPTTSPSRLDQPE